jgi:hypothetical protein
MSEVSFSAINPRNIPVNDTCPICWEPLVTDSNRDPCLGHVTKDITHVFHRACVEPHLTRAHNCPLCQRPIPSSLSDTFVKWELLSLQATIAILSVTETPLGWSMLATSLFVVPPALELGNRIGIPGIITALGTLIAEGALKIAILPTPSLDLSIDTLVATGIVITTSSVVGGSVAVVARCTASAWQALRARLGFAPDQ